MAIVFELTLKYAHYAISESDRGACLGLSCQLWLTHSSKSKRHIFISNTVVWYVEYLYTPCSFQAMHEREVGEERRTVEAPT